MNDALIPEPAPRAAPSMDANIRTAFVWLAVIILAGAIVTAFVSILQVIEIWFDYQYVPIARGVLAVLVAGIALYVLRGFFSKPAKPQA